MNELPKVAVLDACVLYSSTLRDFLLELALGSLYDARWSDQIMEEWSRNLLRNRADLSAGKVAATVAAMNRIFPEATLNADSAVIAQLVLPDPKDRHVLATAIAAEAAIIVTNNLKDFPISALRAYSCVAMTPDQFVENLYRLDPAGTLAAFERQQLQYYKPPCTPGELLERFTRNSLPQTAAWLRRHR